MWFSKAERLALGSARICNEAAAVDFSALAFRALISSAEKLTDDAAAKLR